MKKKFLSSILVFCMVLTMLPTAALAAATPVTVTSIVAAAGDTTTALTVTFDTAITGLTADSFTITDTDSTGATVGTLTGSGTDYTLNITGVSKAGDISVAVTTPDAALYTISGSPVTVALAYKAAPVSKLTPSVAANGTITDGGNATGTFKYAVVDANPATEIGTWTVNTTETEINTALGVSLGAQPTLDYTSNGKYLVVVDISSSSKAVSAGSCVISGLASDFSITTIGAEQAGGAGKTREITCAGTFTGTQYLVVQITEGTGETAKVSVVMVKADTTVTVSYKTTASVYVLITDGMPNLTGSGALGVTIYDSKTAS